MNGQETDVPESSTAPTSKASRRLLPLLPAAMLLVLLMRRVWDVDIFWQLKLGELILAQHGPLRTEPFAALHLGEPLPAVAWGGQALMATARQLFGWTGLRIFDAVCWLGGFGAVALACRRRGAGAQAVALAMGLAFVAALPTASIRPQSFACFCFGLLLALQRLKLPTWQTVMLGVPLLVLWQNLHPSVSVGAMAMAVVAAVEAWNWWRDRSRPFPVAAAILAVAGLAAMIATPDGLDVFDIAARNAEASLAIGASEWRPLWIAANYTNAIPILVVALLTLRIVMRNPHRRDPAELAVALVLFVATISAYRFVLFWAVAMVPVIARAAGESEVPPARGVAWLSLAGLALVALVTPLVAPTRFTDTIPLDALQRLRREAVEGTVYGDFPFGGAIIDVGYPDWRVAYDGRYYRYSRDEWRYNGGIENGQVPLVDVERKWRPAAFVLDARHNAPLAIELAHARRWQRIWSRDGIVVYVPRKSRIMPRESPGSTRP